MASTGPTAFRPGRNEDLEACTHVWKTALDDYQGRLGQPPVPDDLTPLRRLLGHLLATDPDRFWVAVRSATHGAQGDLLDRVIGFTAASVRGDLWFLAMLFVDPRAQSAGLGGALMDRAQAGRDVDPGGPAVPGPDEPQQTGIRRWGMCTDAGQPISNGLYASRGMIPRMPIWRLFGEVRRWATVPTLPRTLEAVPFENLVAGEPDGHRRLAGAVDALDAEIIGSPHAADHAYLRREGRSGFLVRERGGRPLGYAYGSGGGRMGPVAALDPELQPSLIGVAIRSTPVLGPAAMWVPGAADVALRALLQAGLRFDGRPGLICWSAADHPFERYIPISLAIV